MSYNFGEAFLEQQVEPIQESTGVTRSIRSVYENSFGNGSSQSLGANNGASLLTKSASFNNNNNSVTRIAQDLLELQRSKKNVNYTNVNNSNQSANVSEQIVSELESAIIKSMDPIDFNESEEITVNGQRGIWVNRAEVLNWKGTIPIDQYRINEDTNPEVVTKKTQQQIEYVQETAIRYLRPPTPPSPGEIVINQLSNVITSPAPPLIIRQQPARPETPEPMVIREAPPLPPTQVGRKVITISGKRLPPPPRKIIIERLAPLPTKPQAIIIERWLPYQQVKRRVIFNKPTQADPVVIKPRNVIVQWEGPQVQIRKEFKYLGVLRANPVDYVQRYGSDLTMSDKLPQYVLDIKTPDGVTLAADYKHNNLYELEGDLQALNLIDLDKEGLGEYRSYLQRLGIFNQSSSSGSFSSSIETLIEQIFRSVDLNNNGRISVEEAEKILLRLNSRLDRRYGEDDVRAFFNALDKNLDGTIDLNEFKTAFLNINL